MKSNLFSSKLLIALSLVVFLPFNSSYAGNFYKWVDSKGLTHFADSPHNIPPEYRNQVKIDKLQEPDKALVMPEQNIDSEVVGDSAQKGKLKNEPKKYEVPYKPFEGKTARRIIVKVTFNNSVTAPMLFDTGAWRMVISPKIAKKLGLLGNDDGKLLTQIAGISGNSAPAVLSIVNSVKIGEVADYFIPAIISKNLSRDYEGVIGMDFLDNYNMEVNTTKKVLIFKEIPPSKNKPGGHDKKWWKSIFKEFSSYRSKWSKIRKEVLSLLPSKMKGLNEVQKYADLQYKEADKIFNKLDLYAIKYRVPSNWRAY